MSDVTQILQQIETGDPSAAEHLLPPVYDALLAGSVLYTTFSGTSSINRCCIAAARQFALCTIQ